MTYFYAQIAGGMCVAVTQTHAPIEAPDMVPLSGFDTHLAGQAYNAATGFTPVLPPLQPRHLTPLAFRRRFTKEERAAIEWAAVDRADQPNEQRQQAAALRADLADQAQATYVDLDDPDTISSVQGVQALGLIAEGRAEVILGAEVQPEERS